MTEVLHLIDTYRIGGPGKTIINSALRIDASAFRVHVASFTSTDTARNEFASAVRDAGIPYLPLVETKRLNVSHVGILRDYVKRAGIRVLHLHGYRTDVLGWLAVRGLPVAVVTTHHGWIRNNRRQDLFAKLALRLCTRFHGVQLVSERMRDELPAWFKHRAEVAVVRNGIVLEDYVPEGHRQSVRAELSVAADAPLLGVIGRLSIEKGCVEMLDTFAAVRQEVSTARLVFVGEGPLRQTLENRAAELGLAGAVSFVPHQKRVLPYFEAIDLLVSPSRTEGLSNVILEALATGRPVVATRVGGNMEIVSDEESALLVEPLNPRALAASIMRVLRDAGLAHRLVTRGHERVRQEFGFDARMRREEQFYAECLARLERQ